jgi:hypothetical protein
MQKTTIFSIAVEKNDSSCQICFKTLSVIIQTGNSSFDTGYIVPQDALLIYYWSVIISRSSFFGDIAVTWHLSIKQ